MLSVARTSTLRSARFLSARSAATTATISAARCWGSTLVLSDPLVDGVTPAATQSCVSAAAKLGGDSIELLVVGDSAPKQVPAGVAKVIHANAEKPVSETIASTVKAAAEKSSYDYVVGTSSKFGSTVIPRAAALLGASPVTDIIEVVSPGKYSDLLCYVIVRFVLFCSV